MDELIIDERKYVSTKRAAKVTGYAKDYVGQLCREGRVPARLVGRSWYVLESAIQDHRFGAPEDVVAAPVEPAASPLPPTWESARYEAAPVESLPAMRRPESTLASETAQGGASQLQEAWREWFNMRGTPALQEEAVETFTDGVEASEAPFAAAEAEELEPEEHPLISEAFPTAPEEEQVAQEEESEPEIVPIRAIKTEPQPVRPIEEIIPARTAIPETPEAVVTYEKRAPQRSQGVSAFLKLGLATGAFAAVVLASLAFIGSGYADAYVATLGQMRLLAGISVYNK